MRSGKILGAASQYTVLHVIDGCPCCGTCWLRPSIATAPSSAPPPGAPPSGWPAGMVPLPWHGPVPFMPPAPWPMMMPTPPGILFGQEQVFVVDMICPRQSLFQPMCSLNRWTQHTGDMRVWFVPQAALKFVVIFH